MRTRRAEATTARRASWVALACLAAALGGGGCTTDIADYFHNGFKVGPNYHQPATPVAKKWIDEPNAQIHVGKPNLVTWWDIFGDPIMDDLVRRCYTSNLTLRAAGFEVLEAQKQRYIAASELLPQTQTGVFTYTRNEISRNGGAAAGAAAAFGNGLAPPGVFVPVAIPSTPIAGVLPDPTGATTTGRNSAVTTSGGFVPSTGPGRFFDNWATAMNFSWELDFWGLFRRNLEAASAVLDQTAFDFDEMAVLLLANVATQYVEIRTLQRRLELARQNVALQEPLVAAYEKRYKAGIANAQPGYYQLLSNLENTRALIPPLEISLRQANNELCNLLGIPIQDLIPCLGDGKVPDPNDPTKSQVRIPRPLDYAVVTCIPAEALLERPDVKASEMQVRIGAADVGIAEAEMLPHIGINGSIGLAANQFSRLFSTGSQTGTIGPSLTWNILNYGRLLANVRLQNDVWKQYVTEYQQAVLNANQDAENALVAYLQTIEQARHLAESADAAVRVTNYYVRQLKEGYLPPGAADSSAFFTTLFTTINFQVTQQDLAAQAEGNIALNLILVYRALGGGWRLQYDHHKICPALTPGSGAPPPLLSLDTGKPSESAPSGAQPATPPAQTPERLPPPMKLPSPAPGEPGTPPKGAMLELDETALPLPAGNPLPRRKEGILELDDR
jgi:NodT family efflux transporter outer membrane factor (OMF) lipoprotein